MTMVQALNSALDVLMERDPDVVVFGEDVGYFGGVFRVTEGLQKKHGLTRCFDTPITEGGILAAAVGMGAFGLIMLNRLPQDLAGTRAFGLELGMAATQLLWFGVGIAAMLTIAIGLRDYGVLRHYKYSWAAIGILLLAATLLFGYEVNGARLWIDLGPVSIQPGELLKIVLRALARRAEGRSIAATSSG